MKKNVSVLIGLFFLSQLIFIFMYPYSEVVIAKTIPNKHSKLNESLKIKDWFALGSGCKGRAGGVGHIRMNLVKSDRDPLLYQVNFSKGAYELDSFKSITRKPSFARECALRIAAYPPSGFRIADVKASSAITISKDRGAVASIKTQLITTMGSLSEQIFNFDKNTAVQEKNLVVSLSPDPAGRKLLKQIPCEKPKIFGIDFQFFNEKETYVPKVKIKSTQESLATMLIKLEKCSLNVKTQSDHMKPLS